MKRLIRVGILFIFILTTFFSSLSLEVQAQTPRGNTICILETPDTTKFPDVTINFRASDSDFYAMKSLTKDDLIVQENDQKYTPSRLSFDPKGAGLDLYIIIDRGVSADVEMEIALFSRFLDNYAIDGVDRFTVLLTGSNDVHPLINHSNSIKDVKSKLGSFKRTPYFAPNKVLKSVTYALNMIRGEAQSCQRPSAIFVLGGTNAWSSEPEHEAIISTAVSLRTPVYFMHYVGKQSGSIDEYRAIASATKGAYVNVRDKVSEHSSVLDEPIFDSLGKMRGSFSLTYRSVTGESGKRDIALTFLNEPISSDLQRSSYAVDLQAPRVAIISPVEGSDILRTATVFADPEFLYDNDVVPIEFRIDWPDGFERVPSKIRIIGVTSTGEQTIQEINETEFSRSNYSLSWNVDNLTKEGGNPFAIRVEVIDEIGLHSVSTPSNFTVTNFVPEAVAKQTTQEIKQNLKITQYFVYVLAAFILILILLIIIFRKKIKQAFSSTGKIGMAIETVRKTIVGGTGRRKNPIARLEVVRPTVEVKSIFTESVKLGRDPNVSDYTFYSLNSDCSVSGEHAIIVKKRDGWRIIAVSQSGSPVFVDEQRIPMHQEIPIHSGQLIELGYQDLGSALFRFVEVDSQQTFDFAAESEFKPDTTIQMDQGYRRTQVNMPGADDMGFDQFGASPDYSNQNYGTQDFFAQSSTDDDFDSLFDNLRDG